MTTIAETLAVARSNLAARAAGPHEPKRRGRRPQPENELLAEIKGIIAGLPTPAFAGAGSTAIAGFMP